MELWRDAPGYEGLYQVSNYGRVRSLEKTWKCGVNLSTVRHQEEKLLIPSVGGNGYLYATLCKDGKKKQPRIHRLAAQAFLPNPHGFTEVNHKDENKFNNKVENLEWCDRSYNINHGTRNQRMAETLSKRVYQYTLDGRLVKIWPSTAECGRNGFDASAVAKCCNNKYLRAGNNIYKGFRWSYVPL